MATNKPIKRKGYAVLFFLFSAMIFIIPTLAITFKHVVKFSDLTDILLLQKHEKISVLTSKNESIEYLSANAYYLLTSAVLINPISSSELLIFEKSETMGNHTLSSEIFCMNYLISDDSYIMDIQDILNFPPALNPIAEERHFLIKTTVHKSDIPSFCDEIAVEITASGSINKIWNREFVIY